MLLQTTSASLAASPYQQNTIGDKPEYDQLVSILPRHRILIKQVYVDETCAYIATLMIEPKGNLFTDIL